MSSFLTLWTAAVVSAAAPATPPAEAVGSVTGFQVLPIALHTEVVISLDAQVEARTFTMEGPSRVVIDLMGARYSSPTGIEELVNRGGIRTIRASQYSEDVVRIVLEVDGPSDYTVRTGETWVRVALANPTGVDFEPWSSTGAPIGESPAVLTSAAARPVPTPPTTLLPGTGIISPGANVLGVNRIQDAERITISFQNDPIRNVAFAFSDYADRSIVVGVGVDLNISAEIKDQPWDVALAGILDAYGLVAREQASGIIQIQTNEWLIEQEQFEPLVTQVFRVNFANAEELMEMVETLISSDRGRVAFNAATNNISVTDVPRVVQAVANLLEGVDVQTPEVTIAARIMFVNRTDLAEFGVTYDLKDSFGNQLNQLTPGGRDLDGDGQIDFSPDADPTEVVPIGTDVVSLGGSSIAALGNANQRVAQPSLQFLTSLVLGRRTLVSFVEALQSVNLSDVQARPLIRTLDNVPARTQVGERTPIRVADYGSQAGGGAGGQGGANAGPQITVDYVDTGIILEVTPHLASGDLVWMDVYVERSGVELGEIDLGPLFNTQNARSRVLAADGETVVIGGLTVTEKTEVRAGIPILQDLPLLGRLFRLTREQTIQRDLMILLTPQINRR